MLIDAGWPGGPSYYQAATFLGNRKYNVFLSNTHIYDLCNLCVTRFTFRWNSARPVAPVLQACGHA